MLVPTLPDAGSRPWQLFGLLPEGHGDPRYKSVFFNQGANDLPCPNPMVSILLYLYHTRGDAAGKVFQIAEATPCRQRRPLTESTGSPGRATLPLEIRSYVDHIQARLHRPYKKPQRLG